ncbi:transglycosylase SLT domain-containing protein [Streptomyces flavofungini]|uniref:transglycosylase SLT domain-containing protein n=1 Tax=Streptomyces flavofungini TaxID=68200 RepID=UPI0025B004B0|nr:transglycosylase SLT domain-containing protein [Streptomyces flavofungini]WJV49914.1 transglycosylase SLT domain-containing protein [Streptomyces flavofungini]
MATEGRIPIRVGTGLIEVTPKLSSKDMAKLRRELVSELQRVGAASGKEIAKAAKNGLAQLPTEVAKQAKKGTKAVEGAALDSEKTLKRIEKRLSREYGDEVAARFRAFRQAEERKTRLLAETSAATRRALAQTVRQEEQGARDRERAAERLERERIRLQEQARRAHERAERQRTAETQRQARLQVQAQREALRQQVAAQRAATQAQIAEIRRQAAEERARIHDSIRLQQQRIADWRNQIRAARRVIADTDSTTATFFSRAGSSMRRVGTWFDQVGMSINEAGNILTTRFLAPLATAGTALATLGVQNADKRLLGQLGLSSAGVSKDVSAEQMRAIQNYAINTPYSIDVMHEYQMKLIRSVAGADKNWFKGGNKRTGAADNAARKTTDLIMAVGDSMARAGNLNPEQFRRAMYAIDMIMDMDRAPTRNVKQLAAASGMPASELAALLGFPNSQKMWKVIGTPASKGGGVSGTQIMNSLLNYWDPDKYKGSNNQSGSVGSAEKMTSETITGRIQQMKERALFELGNLFVEEDAGGQYKYTSLGEKLMGRKVAQFDNRGRVIGETTEGGLLNTVQDIAKKYAPDVARFLEFFLDSLGKFVETIDGIADLIRSNPVVTEMIGAVARFLVEWGPLILAVGLLSKVLGKVVGVFGRLLAPAAALVRGTARAASGARDMRSQRQARAAARQTAQSAGRSRTEVRQAGRDAYRQQRAQNRNGDGRGPGRRAWDGFLGRDSNQQDQRRQIRELEDQIEGARQEAARLRDELRDVNRESMRQIAQALAGGNGSVQGAANQAQNALNRAQTQARQLNNVSLTQADRELTQAKEKADRLTAALRNAGNEVKTLDSRKLGSLRAQQIEPTTKRVEGLKTQTNRAADAVRALNGKSLSGLRNHFKDTTGSANSTTKSVKNTSEAVNTLKAKSLRPLREWFDRVTSAAKAASNVVGTAGNTSTLNGRLKTLSDRSLTKLNKAVKSLEGNLKEAKGEAQGLDAALGNISKKSPGGGGGGKGRGRGKGAARGGIMRTSDVTSVLPGYSPWVDNIPAVLSPGEAVLRPEVTNAIGEETINSWNAMAIRGRISRHARGTSGGGGRLNLDSIKELMELQNIAPIGKAMTQTMRMDSTSDPLGGGVQGGILGTGDGSARFGGSVAATRFRGMYDWITEDAFSLLKRTPTLVGQAAGILGGSLGPVLGEYFWDDVWRGNGNIVQRGNRFLGHVFSTETLGKVWEKLLGGIRDSAGAIWDSLTSDPTEVFSNVFDDISDIVSGSYNNLIGMVETVKDFKESPRAYAGRVYDNFMSTAQESMPNTKGLFDFDKGAKANAKIPSFGGGMSAPGAGKGVQRWRPVAARALTALGLPKSALSTVMHRIQLESGGNPNIVNRWDSNWQAGHPSVGLMQVIGPTFARYAGPFRGTKPIMYGVSTDPMSNIYAGLNYARSRYGSRWLSVLAGNTGYASGTMSASPGLALVGERGPELIDFGRGGQRVFTNEETTALLSGRPIEIHVHEARNEPTPQAVMRALQQAEALYSPL